MKIIYTDGGVLECSYIKVWGGELVADDIYVIPLDEVESIEED